MTKKVRKTVTSVSSDLTGVEIVGTFYRKCWNVLRKRIAKNK